MSFLNFFFCLRKYHVLRELATFVYGFQLSKVTSQTVVNFLAQVLNTDCKCSRACTTAQFNANVKGMHK